MNFLYSAAAAVALLVTAPLWLVQMVRRPKYRAGLGERLGRVPARLRSGEAWQDFCDVIARAGTMIERFHLREGLLINGLVQQNRKQEGPRLKEITDIDGKKPDATLDTRH